MLRGCYVTCCLILFAPSEFGTYVGELDLTESQWNQYYARMLQTFANYGKADIVVALAFCDHDAMVPGFGLKDTEGRPKGAFFEINRLVESWGVPAAGVSVLSSV